MYCLCSYVRVFVWYVACICVCTVWVGVPEQGMLDGGSVGASACADTPGFRRRAAPVCGDTFVELLALVATELLLLLALAGVAGDAAGGSGEVEASADVGALWLRAASACCVCVAREAAPPPRESSVEKVEAERFSGGAVLGIVETGGGLLSVLR